MSAHDTALTTTESQTLSDCERIINRGLIGFREVGNALLKIRDGKLYRQEHETFEAYCDSRWGMTRRRAYQIMESSEAVESLPPNLCTIVHKEGPARELAKVPAEKRSQVVEVAASAGPVTARSIKQAAAKVVEPSPAPKLEPEPEPTPEPEPEFGSEADEVEPVAPVRKGPDALFVAEKCKAWIEQIDPNDPDFDVALDEIVACVAKARN